MLKQRVLTAIVLIAGFLGALFLSSPIIWLLIVACVCGAAAREWAQLNQFSTSQAIVFALASGCLSLVAGLALGLAAGTPAHAALAGLYVVSAVFWLVFAPLWMARKWRVRSFTLAVILGGLLLIPLTLALAHLRSLDPLLLLAAMGLIWVADIAAYFTGRAFGRHKLAPSISPGKTREGAAGAFVGVLVAGMLFHAYAGDRGDVVGYPVLIPLLIAVTALSIVGDLLESLLKRQAGVKDSGTLLPGHGGILDRIDSLTSTLPLIGLVALWIGL